MPVSSVTVISMRCTCSYLSDPECWFADACSAGNVRRVRIKSKIRVGATDDANRPDRERRTVSGDGFDSSAGDVGAVSGVVAVVCSDMMLLSVTRGRARSWFDQPPAWGGGAG
jgi:hypothetical protein